jgi:hypothetical protein
MKGRTTGAFGWSIRSGDPQSMYLGWFTRIFSALPRRWILIISNNESDYKVLGVFEVVTFRYWRHAL